VPIRRVVRGSGDVQSCPSIEVLRLDGMENRMVKSAKSELPTLGIHEKHHFKHLLPYSYTL